LFTIETFKDGEIIAQTGDYNPRFILIKTGRAHVWHHPQTAQALAGLSPDTTFTFRKGVDSLSESFDDIGEPPYPPPSLLHLISSNDKSKETRALSPDVKEPAESPPPLLGNMNNSNVINESIYEPSMPPPSLYYEPTNNNSNNNTYARAASASAVDPSQRIDSSSLTPTTGLFDPTSLLSVSTRKNNDSEDLFEKEMNRQNMEPLVRVFQPRSKSSDRQQKKIKIGGGGVWRTGTKVSSEGNAAKNNKATGASQDSDGGGSRNSRSRRLHVNASLKSFVVNPCV
jgi:hypothetical protein